MESSENIKFLTTENGETGTLFLKNSISIHEAECLKNIMLESLNCMQYFDINIEELNSIDLSCIQILYSAYETANNLKKKISITGNYTDEFKNDIESAGFNHFNWLYPK